MAIVEYSHCAEEIPSTKRTPGALPHPPQGRSKISMKRRTSSTNRNNHQKKAQQNRRRMVQTRNDSDDKEEEDDTITSYNDLDEDEVPLVEVIFFPNDRNDSIHHQSDKMKARSVKSTNTELDTTEHGSSSSSSSSSGAASSPLRGQRRRRRRHSLFATTAASLPLDQPQSTNPTTTTTTTNEHQPLPSSLDLHQLAKEAKQRRRRRQSLSALSTEPTGSTYHTVECLSLSKAMQSRKLSRPIERPRRPMNDSLHQLILRQRRRRESIEGSSLQTETT